MNFAGPIRVLSDLHIGHPATIVRNVAQLAPLLEGQRTVVFNGDTVEMRYRSQREQAERDLAALRQLCVQLDVVPVFINGNHDPIVSSIDHLDLPEQRVLITHGDILFYSISPWSPEAKYVAAAHAEALSSLDQDALTNFERRLHASKKAALALELHEPPVRHGPLAKLLTVAYQCWPPWRPLHIIRCWILTPGRAQRLARQYRPNARFVLLGHTHYPGLWKRRGVTILNNGGFFPLSGQRLVDIENGTLAFREIAMKNGRFIVGKTLREFPLPATE
jgi:predicted phosphodiesterase